MAIYVQENLNCSITKNDQLNNNKIEQIWIKLKFQKESLLLGCIYRPHDLNDDILDDIINSVKTASDKLVSIGCSSLLIYGDFNFSNTTYENVDIGGGVATVASVNNDWPTDTKFQECLDEKHLTQLVTFPTYRNTRDVLGTNTLDLIITNEPDRSIYINEGSPLGYTVKGQAHCFLQGSIALSEPELDSNNSFSKYTKRQLWSKADYEAISTYMASFNWKQAFDGFNITDKYQIFINKYNDAIALYVPTTSLPYTNKKHKWVTPEVITAVKQKSELWGKYLAASRTNKPIILKQHKDACKNVKKVVKSSLLAY